MSDKLRGSGFLFALAAVFTLAAGILFFRDVALEESQIEESFLKRARAHFRDIVMIRHWNAQYGGVYVEKRPGVETNPYLPGTDIRSTDGRTFVLRNPAAMTRELSDVAHKENDYHFRLTSLKLLNPNNAPDDWERSALNDLENGKRNEVFSRQELNGRTHFRYMAPLYMEASCMRCHEKFGYKVGDIRGGIGISFDISEILAQARQEAQTNGAVFVAIVFAAWLLTLYIVLRHNRHTERLLKEKEVILDNALVGIVFLRNRIITSCNRRFEEMFGYDPGELIGKSTAVLYTSEQEFRRIGEQAYGALSENDTYTEELSLRRKNGEIFFGALNGRALDPSRPIEASIWVYADINERHHLEGQRRFFEQLTEEAPAPVYAIKMVPGYPVAYANRATATHFGYSREELLEQHLKDWDPVYAEARMEHLVEQLRNGGSRTFETTQVHSDGSAFPVEVFARYIEFDGTGYITGFFRDITDRVTRERRQQENQMLLEKLVRHRTEQLTEALDAARLADRTKDEFLANMSHEIRTPLNAILGLTNLALQKRNEENREDYLEKISDAGESLLAILNDLLDLSKITAGKLHLENRAFNLSREVSRVTAMMAHKAADKSIVMTTDIGADAPERLTGDPLRLRQILTNLVSNALKFTHHGRITVRVDCPQQDETGVMLRASVVDTGIGMSAEEVGRIFTPFAQADNSTTRKYGGTGLGLVICKRLAAMMGGDITVASQPGQGSTFTATLRLGHATADELDAASPADLPVLPIAYSDTRVLVVDDQSINQAIAGELLAQIGIVCDFAENGAVALEKVFGQPAGTYDMVLMDIQMPVMDGLTAVSKIRGRPDHADLPVVAMTAHTLVHEQKVGREAGMRDHLGKPFKPHELFQIVARWVDHAKQHFDGAAPDSAPAAPAPAPATPPGDIAFDEALARFSGRIDKYHHWLNQYLHDLPGTLHEAEVNLREGDFDAAHRILHGLKGKSGALGILRIHKAVEAVDDLAKQGSPHWQDAWRVLCETIDPMRASLEAYLASAAPGSGTSRENLPS